MSGNVTRGQCCTQVIERTADASMYSDGSGTDFNGVEDIGSMTPRLADAGERSPHYSPFCTAVQGCDLLLWHLVYIAVARTCRSAGSGSGSRGIGSRAGSAPPGRQSRGESASSPAELAAGVASGEYAGIAAIASGIHASAAAGRGCGGAALSTATLNAAVARRVASAVSLAVADARRLAERCVQQALPA